jgi:hypothetical protein
MPARPLGLVHAPINSRSWGLIGPQLPFAQKLGPQGLDLGFGLRPGSVQAPLKGPPMRDAAKAQPLPQGDILGQERNPLLGLKCQVL